MIEQGWRAGVSQYLLQIRYRAIDRPLAATFPPV